MAGTEPGKPPIVAVPDPAGPIAQVRYVDARVSDHDLTLESPRLSRRGVSVHAAPLPEMPGAVVLTLQDGSTAQMLDRQLNFRGAARGACRTCRQCADESRATCCAVSASCYWASTTDAYSVSGAATSAPLVS